MYEYVFKYCLTYDTSTFISNFSGGTVLAQLLEWLRWHFIEGDNITREALHSERPQDHPQYWDSVREISVILVLF